jgi:DNA-binding transcriptional ArsR family regulator
LTYLKQAIYFVKWRITGDITMDDFMDITKALSDENRVRILMSLQKRELCVCQIIELLGLAPSTVSKHISILKHAKLIKSRKDGLWMHYSLPSKPSAEIKQIIEWVCCSLGKNEKIQADIRKMNKILKMKPETICQQQKCKCK